MSGYALVGCFAVFRVRGAYESVYVGGGGIRVRGRPSERVYVSYHQRLADGVCESVSPAETDVLSGDLDEDGVPFELEERTHEPHHDVPNLETNDVGDVGRPKIHPFQLDRVQGVALVQGALWVAAGRAPGAEGGWFRTEDACVHVLPPEEVFEDVVGGGRDVEVSGPSHVTEWYCVLWELAPDAAFCGKTLPGELFGLEWDGWHGRVGVVIWTVS